MSGLGALALAASLAQAGAQVVAVRSERVEGRPAIRVLLLGEAGPTAALREGREVVLPLGASAEGVALPAPEPPIEALRLTPGARGATLRVQVPPELDFELSQAGSLLTLSFGPRRPAALPDVAALYPRIFPQAPSEAPAAPLATPAGGEDQRPSGLSLGRLSLRPTLTLTWVSGDSFLTESPQPVHDDYLEIQPGIGFDLPVASGQIRGDYHYRFRAFSAFPEIQGDTHLFNLGLELPLGSRTTLRADDHFAGGIVETYEVDPGGEYFFDLGRFQRNTLNGSARVELGARSQLDLAGSHTRVHFLEESGFTDYDEQLWSAGLRMDVRPSLEAWLGYLYERVPAQAERPQIESTAHTAALALKGDLGPRLKGELLAGYRWQDNPQAAEGGTSFDGVTARVELTRPLTPSVVLHVAGGRAPEVSNFEDNAFYVSDTVQGELTLPLPLGLSGRVAAGYHWNSYRTAAAGLDEPRRDEVFGWSVGVGRPLGRWAYLRADYRKDRRDSNLPAFDIDTEGFSLQLGLGYFGGAR